MQRLALYSLREGVFVSKLGLEDSNCKSQWHSKMDRDQQLNFTTSIKCTMDRFIGQLKFAGKTYMNFEMQESSSESCRNQSFLFQEVQLRHAVSNCCIYPMLTNHSSGCIELCILCTMRIATVCNILHKEQKLHILQILHIAHIFMDSHT